MSQTAVLSPINSYLWPIPIPKPLIGVNYGRSRTSSEIYNYSDTKEPILLVVKDQLTRRDIEYCWLDVLCLRQSGGIREQQRPLEWEIFTAMHILLFVT